ncbi:MAG: group 1 truncated hemoglobin [Deltaproteobacteria bacterium]|nr:group 1 truncated hemoglobin [Deltaproteobacteria bacterium]
MSGEHRRRRGDLAPDPELWAALAENDLLGRILRDFYERVYADPRLAHFFEGVTRQRAVEKQYSFLKQIFSGEKCYFGDRPRNAHHWMVISDELFDHREALMEQCLRRHGLADHLVRRWRATEEVFRKQIVKAAPRPRKLGGVELPLEGYDDVDVTVGMLCDACGSEVPPGARVRYHVRTGRSVCAGCVAQGASAPPGVEVPR